MFSTLSKQQEKLLQTSPLFDSLTPEQIRPVLYCLQAEVRRAAPRQIIIQPQECSSGLFIVLSGAIELVHTDAGGRKSTMNILYPGDCHCENVGLLDALSAQVQVLALDEVTMIKLDINRIFAPDSCQCPYKLAVVENLVRILSADNDFLKLKATLFSQKSLRSKLLIYLRASRAEAEHRHRVCPLQPHKAGGFSGRRPQRSLPGAWPDAHGKAHRRPGQPHPSDPRQRISSPLT